MMDPKVMEAFADGRLPNQHRPNVTVEYVSESRDEPAIIGIFFVTGLTFAVVMGRLLSRALVVRRFGLDDGLVLVSLLVFGVFVGLCIRLINLGSGRHYDYIRYVLDLPTVQHTQVLDFFAHLIYCSALLLCRASGLAFYDRVCNLHRGLHVAICIVFVLLFAAYLLQMLLITFHCLPVTGLWPYGWEPGIDHLKCLRWGRVYVVISTISLVCDFLLFGIPVAMLRILEMPRRRKIQLGCILLPGTAVIAISVTRLALVIFSQWQADVSWPYNPMLVIEVSEISATLAALSLPGLKPMYDRFILHKNDSLQNDMHMYHMRGVAMASGATPLNSFNLHSQYTILDGPEGRVATADSLKRSSLHMQQFHSEAVRTAGGAGPVARGLDTEVSAGTHGINMSQDGIHVTVDVQVNDDDHQLKGGREKPGLVL